MLVSLRINPIGCHFACHVGRSETSLYTLGEIGFFATLRMARATNNRTCINFLEGLEKGLR